VPALVVKRDGQREPYDRTKVLGGLIRACEKRPVTSRQLEAMVDAVEAALNRKDEREIHSDEIGQILMAKLRALDQVAYVRFASVYRRFEDIEQFLVELERLRKEREVGA
jgi:transcriptional repressor NrdR